MASGSKEAQHRWRVVVGVASFGDAGEFLGRGHDGRVPAFVTKGHRDTTATTLTHSG